VKRLLFIAHKVPYPPDKGDRLRAFHEIKALSEQFDVTLAALAHSRADRQAAEKMRQWCRKVVLADAGGRIGLVRGAWSLLAGRSVTEGYFRSRRLAGLLADEAGAEPFDLVMAYCSSMLPYAADVPAPAKVMDLVDADSAKWAAYAERARWPKRWAYRTEARRVAGLERRAVDICDAVLLVSDAEAGAVGIESEKLIGLPNGVDMEYFTPADRPAGAGAALVFTGTMDYRPNVEGVCWFVREAWGGLKRQEPDLTLAIVGRNPAPAVRRLGGHEGVTVTGAVPDVRPYLAAATAAVVPLQIARGLQNKVLEAMAMGRAVVATPAALEGIEADREKEVLAADTPEEWTRQILLVLRDNDRRRELERAARKCVEDKYSWPARMEPLVALCLRLTGPGSPPRE